MKSEALLKKKKTASKRKTPLKKKTTSNTSLVVKGLLAHRLQNPKWPPGGPKMADRVWKGVYP